MAKTSEETKIKTNNLELCKDNTFRVSRANYKEKNGMYGSTRFE
jgi:hypothetical protein